jgi:hypothetical protein
LDQIVELVSLGRLIVVVGATAADRIGDSVVAVPVTDSPATKLVLAWADDADAARTAFVRVALDTAAALTDRGRLIQAS